MGKCHRCFANQNLCAYTNVEMGIEKRKASDNTAYKQFCGD